MGTWGISLRSLARDEPIYALNARKLLMPASTTKIVTLAVAADQLGWDFTFRTRLAATAPIHDGTLDGDLVVIGGGDPTIDDWNGNATALFTRWADVLKRAGLRRVNGRLVGDDDAFEEDGLGTGWAWDDLAASYATRIGALQFNQNTAQLLVTPGARAGAPATFLVRPPAAPVSVMASVATSASEQPPSIALGPAPRGHAIEARGTMPAGGPPIVRNVSVDNPTLYFVNALRQVLVQNGIEILGASVDADDLSPRPSVAGGATALADVASPPLSVVSTTMMKMSQNLYAETLLRTLGMRNGASGTVAAGRDAIHQTLTRWNIPTDQLALVDGSGLSRYNVVTPDAMTAVLVHVWGDMRLRDPFIQTLPVAGTDGTLSERMKNTPAMGNARAKTGSFSNARAVAGYVWTADKEPVAFTIIANHFGVGSDAIDAATDAIVAAVAAFRR
jgi:D-alanyl-D-alanine carboxypeptidase/D-alanyl-D-alanine-endopeptidase (penicillin-binding protein 4)